jgi:sulfur relay (sulfurtransferase) DsrC/TusE family protein
MTQDQILLIIESLEELNEELSMQNKGTLLSEHWDLLIYLKTLIDFE